MKWWGWWRREEPAEPDYYPEPYALSDGDCLIYDPAYFAEAFGGLAVVYRDGSFFVFDEDLRDFRKVEPAPRAAKVAQIKK
jgi:hypothetical protein